MNDQLTGMIEGCFGEADLEFASGESEREQARDLLKRLLTDGVSWSELEGAVRNFLSGKNCHVAGIEEQISSMKDLETWLG